MVKNDLISNVATSTGFTKKDIKVALEATFDEITKAIASGEAVSISGFGKFEAIERSAREVRNPQTGEMIQVAAKKSPKFKAASALKTAVNA